jgi:hypothetical protein
MVRFIAGGKRSIMRKPLKEKEQRLVGSESVYLQTVVSMS